MTKIDLANSTTTFYTLNYEYDTFNRRISREKIIETDTQGGEGGPITHTTAEKFVYDGDNVALDFYKPDGGSFALAHRYLFGPAVDQILAQENVDFSTSSADRVYWFLSDNLGSTRELVDKDGSLVYGGHYNYDAFGRVLDGDTPLTRYLYTGREYDLDTELQYNRNRWYDPNSGRWLSEDPIGFWGGDSNLYRYVGNSPTNYTDPSGLVHQTPPAGWYNDPGPLGNYANRMLWDAMKDFRAHGGEGRADREHTGTTDSPVASRPYPSLPPILGAGQLNPGPFGWPSTLPPMVPSNPPPGDTDSDAQRLERAALRTAREWFREYEDEFYESLIEELDLSGPWQEIVRRGRGRGTEPSPPIWGQQRRVETPGPLRGLYPRGATIRTVPFPGGRGIEVSW